MTEHTETEEDRRPVRPDAPRTPAQRRAVATLVEHGRVWVQGRGRWAVSGTNGAEVSGAMSVWLQVHGWARWDHGRGGGSVLVVLTRGPGAHGIRAVPARAPFPGERPVNQCTVCGRRWTEDTPAGRCPWEDVHPAE